MIFKTLSLSFPVIFMIEAIVEILVRGIQLLRRVIFFQSWKERQLIFKCIHFYVLRPGFMPGFRNTEMIQVAPLLSLAFSNLRMFFASEVLAYHKQLTKNYFCHSKIVF